MKHLFITLCFYAVFGSLSGQVVYKPRLQTIKKDSPATVDWIAYSTFEQTVNINRVVEFINVVDEKLTNSVVNCDLIKISGAKKELIKRFICATGDGQQTSLIADAIKLSIGDRLYFNFNLISVDTVEEFVFNIFDKNKKVVEKPNTLPPVQEYTPPYLAISGNQKKKKPSFFSDPQGWMELYGKKRKKKPSKFLQAIM